MKTEFTKVDYILVLVTLVFLGLFAYQVIAGQDINSMVHDTLLSIIAIYLGVDKLGYMARKYETIQKEKNGHSGPKDLL